MAIVRLDTFPQTADGGVSHVLHRIGWHLLVPVTMLLLTTAVYGSEYMVVGAAEVLPIDNSVAYNTNGASIRLPPGTVAEFQAPVQLPHNASIVSVILEAHDEGGGEFGGYVRADLVRYRYFSYGIITQSDTGGPAAPGDTRIAVPAYGHVVDNSEYSYAVYIRINNVSGTAWETVMFYKVFVEYIPSSSGIAPESEPLILHQLATFPNPSSELFQVSYRTEADAEVSGQVYDVSGRLVMDVFRGHQKAGAHLLVWNGRDERGAAVAAGTYMLTVTVGREMISRKVVLVR